MSFVNTEEFKEREQIYKELQELREQLEKCEQELIAAKDEVLNLGEFLYESEKENKRLREIISSYESGEMIGGAKYE